MSLPPQTEPPPTVDEAAAEARAELRKEMAELTLSMVKGMLQASYYSPDHPAAKGVALDAYGRLKELDGRFPEITYMITGTSKGDEVALDGVFDESVGLSALIKSTLGEHFAGKLRAFFQRNRIVSVSIKSGIDEAEFDRFIGVFVERNIQEPGEIDRDVPFSDQLYDREVVNVSVILEDDMVGARRKLPWRVRMAISRLRKDLRVLPLFAKATHKELRDAKQLLIQDIIRPLKQPEFLKDLLVNSDLILTDVSEMRGADVETDIIVSLSRSLLGSLAWALTSELERLVWEKVKKNAAESQKRFREMMVTAVKRNLRKVALRLAREHFERAQELLRHLFEKELLSFEELPPLLQQQIRVERWTDAYLADREGHFEQFEATITRQNYLEQLSVFAAIFRELVERGQLLDVYRILMTLVRHWESPTPPFPERSADVDRALKQIRRDETLAQLARALDEPDRGLREHVRDSLVLLGVKTVPHILEVFREAESSAVRKDAGAAITAIGPEAALIVVEDLRKHRRNWQYARALIGVLGELDCQEVTADLIRFSTNPHAKLREAALVALHRLRGKNAESQFVTALGDLEVHVQRRALVLLNAVGSTRSEIAAYAAEQLRPRDADEEEPWEIIQKLSIDVLQRLGNVPIANVGSAEDVLVQIVEHGERSPVLRLLKRRRRPKPESLRVHACDALAVIGSRAVEPVLAKLRKDRSAAVADHAAAALEAIRTRK